MRPSGFVSILNHETLNTKLQLKDKTQQTGTIQ